MHLTYNALPFSLEALSVLALDQMPYKQHLPKRTRGNLKRFIMALLINSYTLMKSLK